MKLVRTGKVRLNGSKTEIDARVHDGDVVEVDESAQLAARPDAAPPAANAAPRGPVPAWLAPRILFEDADILAFDKQPGMVSHVGSGHAEGVVDLLNGYLGTAPDAAFRPALANRLDRDTSGVLLLAKTELALRRLNESMRRGTLEKGYLALVRGAPEPPAGRIEAALRKEKSADGLERMAVVPPEAPGALAAATRYATLRVVGGGEAALLDVTLETGRTHQIRAHLTHLGHPVALDRKYGSPAFNADLEARTGLRRLFLHASRLGFPHPRTGERRVVEAPLAKDLADALERLG
jgi:23S rRNA pseudouridine955/2504/2580 synthase